MSFDPQAPHDSPDPAAPAAPFTRRAGVVLSVVAGLLLGMWLYSTPSGVMGKADAIGYAICHRIAERSFHFHERQQPLCARCTGIYLGVLVALGIFARRRRLKAVRLPRTRIVLVLVVLGAVYGADGLNSYLTLFPGYTPLYAPHNTLRLLTGFSFGITLITLALPFINGLVWRAPEQVSAVESWRDLGTIYAVSGMVVGLILTAQPMILWVTGLLSAAGVLVMFGMVGSVTFLMLARRENRARTWQDLVVPGLAGVAIALIIIGGIDLARYIFTGSWAGFTLS